MGKSELLEVNEGISYGVNDIRDGVNMSPNKALKHIVLPSEISQLDNLNGFIKLGKSHPIARFTLTYKSYKTIAPAYVPLEMAPSPTPKPADIQEDKNIKNTDKTSNSDTPESTIIEAPINNQMRTDLA